MVKQRPCLKLLLLYLRKNINEVHKYVDLAC